MTDIGQSTPAYYGSILEILLSTTLAKTGGTVMEK